MICLIQPSWKSVVEATLASFGSLPVTNFPFASTPFPKSGVFGSWSFCAPYFFTEKLASVLRFRSEFGDSFITRAKRPRAGRFADDSHARCVAKVAADRSTLASFSVKKYGAQKDHDPNTPDFGNGVLRKGSSSRQRSNDANVASTTDFQEGWIKHIIAQWGLSGAGGLRYYMLDQEPGIWYVSHRDVHPMGAKMEEVRDRMIALAKKIRANDPNASIVGPDEWNYEGYLASGYDEQYGALNGFDKTPDRDAHGGMDYLPWCWINCIKASWRAIRGCWIFSACIIIRKAGNSAMMSVLPCRHCATVRPARSGILTMSTKRI